MEKENKKLRYSEKKKFNDEVHQLLIFCKNRDPRYESYKLEQKRIEEEKRLEEEKEREEREEKRKIEIEEKRKQRDKYIQEMEEYAKENKIFRLADEDEEEEKKTGDIYICDACNKKFKNSKQFENHESIIINFRI